MTAVPGWTDGLPYALFRANQAVQRRLAEAIDDMGVTITQLGIAVHLDELGHLSGSDLARRFKITPQSAAAALAALESRGWVTRVPHPFHGRVIWYEVTEAGHTGALEGRRRLAVLHDEFERLLGGPVVDKAIARLQAVSDALDGAEVPAVAMWPAL
ncbi:MarR family winged helix-turn-helix transcriptional regulator [Microbacterium phosphatis]|uniref:MarR family winged helix-turn-helix transcriptional regulator n=1 Tax=Microbacterium phosphatis TaxID=3140248 RepID=UPI003140C6FE